MVDFIIIFGGTLVGIVILLLRRANAKRSSERSLESAMRFEAAGDWPNAIIQYKASASAFVTLEGAQRLKDAYARAGIEADTSHLIEIAKTLNDTWKSNISKSEKNRLSIKLIGSFRQAVTVLSER